MTVRARARVREGRSDDEDWTMKGFKARLVFGADFFLRARAMGLPGRFASYFQKINPRHEQLFYALNMR